MCYDKIFFRWTTCIDFNQTVNAYAELFQRLALAHDRKFVLFYDKDRGKFMYENIDVEVNNKWEWTKTQTVSFKPQKSK